jgi:hypothetical protein
MTTQLEAIQLAHYAYTRNRKATAAHDGVNIVIALNNGSTNDACILCRERVCMTNDAVCSVCASKLKPTKFVSTPAENKHSSSSLRQYDHQNLACPLCQNGQRVSYYDNACDKCSACTSDGCLVLVDDPIVSQQCKFCLRRERQRLFASRRHS